jgi:hypothetical protein
MLNIRRLEDGLLEFGMKLNGGPGAIDNNLGSQAQLTKSAISLIPNR